MGMRVEQLPHKSGPTSPRGDHNYIFGLPEKKEGHTSCKCKEDSKQKVQATVLHFLHEHVMNILATREQKSYSNLRCCSLYRTTPSSYLNKI